MPIAVTFEAMIQIGNSPTRFEHEPGDRRHLIEIEFLGRIRGSVIVHMDSGRIENERNAVAAVVPVIGTEDELIGTGRVVVVIVELEFLIIGVRGLAEVE